MFLADYHVHTCFSFDHDRNADCTTHALCHAALDAGLSEIAFTDHYCVNGILDGSLPPVDMQALSGAVAAAKEAFKGRLTVVYGIELGQPAQRDAQAQAFLAEHKFDFVIGSLHNNAGAPDFYYLDYRDFSPYEINSLWDNYLQETLKHIRWGAGRFCALGHLNYLDRYIHRDGMAHHVSLDDKMEVYREIFSLMIDEGIALELNTSGYRKGLSDTVPGARFVQLYHELGGALFTVGSDAHTPALIGDGVRRAYELLQSMGVTEIATFPDGKLTMRSIL